MSHIKDVILWRIGRSGPDNYWIVAIFTITASKSP